MKTTEDIFRDSIDQYKVLITDASDLNKRIENLSPEEILHRCESLQKQQNRQAKIDKFIIEIMLDFGPGILETPYIGEYQEMLDKAMQACDEVALKAQAIRTRLQTEIQKLQQTPKEVVIKN